MTEDAIFGKLISEHRRDQRPWRALTGCGPMLLIPFLGGACALYNGWNDTSGDAEIGRTLSAAVVIASVSVFVLLAVLVFVSPAWLSKYKVQIFENGLKLTTAFKSKTCLWTEVATVNAMLLTTPANRPRVRPADFAEHEGGDVGGIYEIIKTDGTKILISRQYSDPELVDNVLARFCNEPPRW